MTHLWRDLRRAFGEIRHAPGFTALVLLSVGLGIGVNTTVFAWLDNLVQRPFPAIPDSGRLVVLNVADAEGRVEGMAPIAHLVLQEWVAQTNVFERVAAHAQVRLSLRGTAAEAGEPVWSEMTAANFFTTLRVFPAYGRFFDEADERDRRPVVVLSHAFWRRRFGGETAVIGRSVLVNGVPLTVIGVGPPRFGGVVAGLSFDLWVPLWMQRDLLPGSDWMRDRSARRLQAVARLRPGVGLSEAGQALNSAARDVSRSSGETPMSGAGARWISDTQLGSLMGPLGTAMIALTAVVLLIACANVAGLLLARGISRQKQAAIALALGASPRHLVQQALVHAGVLALLGCAVGLWIARATKDVLTSFVPRVALPVNVEIDLNLRVVLFAMGVALLSAFMFALLPALRTSNANLVDVLKTGGGGGGRPRGLRHGLVVAQVAFSVMALAVAGLFLRSVAAAGRVPLGFDDPAAVLLVSTDVSFTRTEGRALAALVDRALDNVRRQPGVAAAAFATFVPLSFGGPTAVTTRIDEYVPGPEESMSISRAAVSDGYFTLMGIPVVEGRLLVAADRAGSARVAVVNQAFARRYWPGRSAVGRQLEQGGDRATVVGVVRDSALDSLADPPRPIVYRPWEQAPAGAATWHVRSAGPDPLTLVEPVRRALAAAHPDLAALDPGTLADHMQAGVFVQSVGAGAFSAFGAIALLIVTIGVYGVVAQHVAERRRDLAMAVALGARARTIAAAVAGPALRLSIVGMILGAGLAASAAVLLRNQLIGIAALDAPSVVGGLVLLALAAAAACAWPTWRATRTDPIIVIRSQ